MRMHGVVQIVAVVALAPTWQAAAAQNAPGREIRGTVYDSLDARPLAGAHIMLLDRSDSAIATRATVADSLGRFRFDGVAPGVYLIGFDAPLIDSLGISVAPRQVALAARGKDPFVVPLAMPAARTVRNALCARKPKDDSTSVLVGHLNHASTRSIASGGVVTAQWLKVLRAKKRIATTWPTVSVRSAANGSYVLCGLPPNTEVAVQATTDSSASASIGITTPATLGVIRRELYLTDSAAPRGGILAGIVRSAAANKPVARAQVRVVGDSTIATTGPDGRFVLRDLPYGTLAVDARSLGFVPQEQDVDVLMDGPGHVTFSMVTTANMLDTVRTYADPTGFEKRRKAGWGRYLLPEDIQRKHAFDVADVVRGVPGVFVTGLGFHAQPLMHSLFPPPIYCMPNFYLDGRQVSADEMNMFMQPKDIAGVEVYADPAEAPAYLRGNLATTCGTIIMWTKQQP